MFDVIKNYEKVSQSMVEAFSKLEESASINESLPDKNGALVSSIKPVWRGTRMCGRALTVECGIGDNIMLHKAISMAGPGDVLMVTNGMYSEAGGMFGGMMAASLKSVGAAGLVIEGACRDIAFIEKLDFPVFSEKISIKATTKLCPGKINHPIVIGGVRVCPGDLVFGDDDGVVVVPKEITAQVLETAQAREARENDLYERIMRGETTTFEMFEENFKRLGLNEE